MKREEFRARRKGSFKDYSFFNEKLKIYIGQKDDKITDFVIHSYFFCTLYFTWNLNGWCLNTFKPVWLAGLTQPVFVPMNLIWWCKDLTMFPAPDTKHVIMAKSD